MLADRICLQVLPKTVKYDYLLENDYRSDVLAYVLTMCVLYGEQTHSYFYKHKSTLYNKQLLIKL